MANYSYTDSRNVALLRNIVYGEDNPVTVPPESRIEKILQAILGESEYSEQTYSRMERILKAIANDETITDMTPISRNEAILLSKMAGTEYTEAPQSQIEEILLDWDIHSGKTKNALIWASGEATGALIWANASGTETGTLIYAEEGEENGEE